MDAPCKIQRSIHVCGLLINQCVQDSGYISKIALTLLKRGKDSIDEISSITKLSVEFITQLAIDNNIAYTM